MRGRAKDLASKYFFMKSEALQAAKLKPNAIQFATALLVSAFSDKALFECTVAGGQYRAGGKAKIHQKPALDASVVAVILGNFLLYFSIVYLNLKLTNLVTTLKI